MTYWIVGAFVLGVLAGARTYAWGLADGYLRGRLAEIEFQDKLRETIGGGSS